jgi:hypothetical protein
MLIYVKQVQAFGLLDIFSQCPRSASWLEPKYDACDFAMGDLWQRA